MDTKFKGFTLINNVYQCVHLTPLYFQECGRAGRDGEPAIATLFYNKTDIRANRPGMNKAMIDFCNTSDTCLRDSMLHHFAYSANDERDKSKCCSVCNPELLDKFNVSVDGDVADTSEIVANSDILTSGLVTDGCEEAQVIVLGEELLAQIETNDQI